MQQIYQYLFNALIYHYLMNSCVKAYSKLKWTPEEEQLLRSLKQEKHIESWKIIATEMNLNFQEKNRSGKQCRERYMNYVRFGKELPKMTGWTPEEDEQLFLKFMEHGAKWVQIGKEMVGRSQNCLKNRFYGAMRKIIRKINRAAKQKRLRQKKPIKTDLLIRILQYQFAQAVNEQKDPLNSSQFLQSLKKEMIKIAINPEQNASPEQIQSLINGIIKFCSLTKSPSNKKQSRKASQSQQQQGSQQNIENKLEGICDESDENQSLLLGEEIEGEKLQKKQSQLGHRIVSNLIIFSSQQLRGPNPHQINFNIFEKNNSQQNLTSAKYSN